MHTTRARGAAALTGAAAVTLFAGHAVGQVQVEDGQTLTEEDLLAGMFDGESFTLDADAVFDINSGGAIGPVGFVSSGGLFTSPQSDPFDFRGASVNINAGGVFSGLFERGQSGTLYRSAVSNVKIHLDRGGVIQGGFLAGDGAVVQMSGGEVGENFIADAGSVVNITGGMIGDMFRASDGGTVNMSGGRAMGSMFANAGSTLRITGDASVEFLLAQGGGEATLSGDGTIDTLRVLEGGRFSMTGGRVGGHSQASFGARVDISGGSVGERFSALRDSHVAISGGTIEENFTARSGSRIEISGGVFGQQFRVEPSDRHNTTSLTLSGGEFQVDGRPVSKLDDGMPAGGFFTGTLADGSVFIFSSLAGDSIATDVTTLSSAPLPAIDTTPMIVSTGQGPSKGLRAGQRLTLAGDEVWSRVVDDAVITRRSSRF